jgi:hypothetical protein
MCEAIDKASKNYLIPISCRNLDTLREKIYMTDWGLAVKIFYLGLSTVFCSLAILIGAIYAFGKILEIIEKKGN